MSSPAEDLVDTEPPTIDPYEVLGLERDATADQVKSAYRKAALKNHPDKVPQEEREQAHKSFQSIAFAYAILSDPARRHRYDSTGSTAESIVDAEGFDWSTYYRELFADAISPDAIERFARTYRNSDEERDDLLAAYEDAQGDMDGVYASVMLSDVLADDARFRTIIDAAIRAGDVDAYPAYTKESKKKRADRVKAAKAEANEAEEYAKELGQRREGFFDHLEAKYGASSKPAKGKKRRAEEEPSEEAFQAAAARLKKGKGEGRSKR
ncbi:unnamed protein product [Parascedosporium putredinis]|uniref:J domain-containing protein n=1 Tax=Parascedosporium putredinis TaxID=1442378 RepID=A0A9P1HCE8_9PEZI|nr:unnamed protein product [Parascedosporium putredinis]CAI8004698.1 unnamed protein product [Parascedosporium putredinis]